MPKKVASRSKEHTIKLTISLDEGAPKAAVEKAPAKAEVKSIFIDETDLFKLANLVATVGERSTEHGKTPIRVVEFREEAQRKKIIRLLVENYSEVVWKLLPLLRQHGMHPRAEIRKRAAETAGELMRELDFIRVKDEVLMPWAMSPSPAVNTNVGLSLAVVARDTRYAENVKALLNHWVTLPNPDLNWTALASCVPLCSLWPEEILDYLEKSLDRGRVELLALTIFVVRELCQKGHTGKVMARLSEWIRRSKDEQPLRAGAALIFLEAIDFPDIVGKGSLIDKAVEVFLIGLGDRSLDNLGAIRAVMLDKLKTWAEKAFEKKSQFDDAEKLFARLYLRSDERGRERIEFQLDRWSRSKDERTSKKFKRLLNRLRRKEE